MLKGILFDLDGTLLDTNDLIFQSFQHTIRLHYGRDADLDVARAYFGKPLRDALLEMGPDKVDEMLLTYRQFNFANHDRLAKVFAGTVEVVQALAAHGLVLAIVTSKLQTTARRGLRLFDLDKYFPVVIGHDECRHHKPHPEPVRNALAALSLSPADCLMVGDSPFDLISARRAGVKTAAVRWTEVPWPQLAAEHPDYILESPADLLTVAGIGDNRLAESL